ncbi:MAG TPA: SMC family ATPase, partial [Saprospiraceae bacterium]|nr:SMC family ATPase [Saprospiraceae bacterium]
MILKNLQLKNFKQYAALQLDFQEGLIGIVGKNGSGKSSIFEAILLCLFGSSNTDKEFYKTSWAENKENVLLELSFELNQKHFIVRREFRGKALAPKAQLFNQEDKLIATGAKIVNKEVEHLIGMDKEGFTRSVFSGQKELGAISGTKGEERKKMVRKMIGLDNLDYIQKMIREDRNHIKKQIQFHEETLLEKDALDLLTTEIKEIAKNIKSSNKTLTQLNKISEKTLKKYHKAKLV